MPRGVNPRVELYSPSSIPPPPCPSPYAIPSPPTGPPGPVSLTVSSCTVPVLQHWSDIWTADGWFKLPFFGCESRAFMFSKCDPELQDPSVEYRKLVRAEQERWIDRRGYAIKGGHAVPVHQPQITIRSDMASLIADPGRRGEFDYIVVRKAQFKRDMRSNVECSHANGDSIYEWVSCGSWGQLECALVETCSLGFSGECWPRLRKSKSGKYRCLMRRIISLLELSNSC